MNAEKHFPFTSESGPEIDRLRKLADSLGVQFDEVVHSGSQGTTIGIQSKSVLFSQRLDSRTFFVHDSRYRVGGELGIHEASDQEYIKGAHEILEKLDIPRDEIAETSVLKEATQTAEYDRDTQQSRLEEVQPGKRYVALTRQIERLPVWSSRVVIGLARDGRIGFLEAHWPEIPKVIVAEARKLSEKVREGWRPREQPGAKVIEIEAGILHSPAAGFVMDIYPAIRVIYASTDERFGKKAVAYLDRHGNPVPVPRQFDLPAEKPTAGRPEGAIQVEHKRVHFRELLLANSQVLKGLQNDTSYEELGCVGYQPQFRRLEAVVYVKRHFGYGGGLCSAGTPEYVRFYLSFDNGATWQDQGMTSFTAWDIPFLGERLEYAVTLDIQPNEKLCLTENLPLVRAILSWNSPPPPNAPDQPPHWGNVKEARIQIGAIQLPLWEHIFHEAKLKLPKDFAAIVDLEQPAYLKKKTLTAGDLIAHYRGKGVPEHRFLAAEVQKWVAKPEVFATFSALKVDWAKIIEQLLATDGDTRFEELTCAGLNPDQDRLIGVINVKLPNGYSGGLCSAGSQEYVAFWVDYGSGWTYAGTTSVNVHDLAGIPQSGGLNYAVFLPVDLTARRKPCEQGPVTAKVRAILSWNTAPPAGDPDFRPVWGNRQETLIHIKAGPQLQEHQPFLSSVGDVGESQIDATGKANGTAIHTGLVCSDSPFGGRITIAGHIASPSAGMRYRVMRKLHAAPDTAYAPLTFDPLTLLVNTFNGVFWSQNLITVTPDPSGYYSYEDYSWDHSVETSLMGVWNSSPAEDGQEYALRIDVSTDGNPAHDLHSNVVTVLIDNTNPDVSLSIDLGGGVQCADFAPGAEFTGKFKATDLHFQRFQFEIQPSGPPNDPPHGVLPVPPAGISTFYGGAIGDPGVAAGTFTLNTGVNPGPPKTGPMDPCGYALILHVWDRTNTNSGGSYNYHKASVGFCLRA